MGHYAGRFPNNKKKKQVGASTEEDEFIDIFERDFSLLICLSMSATSTSVWYIDSGVSNHMTSVCKNFTNIIENDVDLDVYHGNDSKVKEFGHGIVSFQREFQWPMVVRDVLYVPRLVKSLISVFAIEENQYEVIFQDGDVLLHPNGSSLTSTKMIGIRHGKLCRLMFHPS
jgi:hypothetical protein